MQHSSLTRPERKTAIIIYLTFIHKVTEIIKLFVAQSDEVDTSHAML